MVSRRSLNISVCALLAVALFLVIFVESGPRDRAFTGTLEKLLARPEEIAGWTLIKHPVSETPEMKKTIEKTLGYDDSLYIIYKKGDLRVSMYVSYWAPGKMSHRLIGGHTPDVCWVGGGWQQLARGIEYVNFPEEGNSLMVEHRVFSINGQTEHVVFCHLVGGWPISYQTHAQPPWYAMFSDLLGRGVAQREEQLFLRISSDRAFGQFIGTPPVQMFFKRLSVEVANMRRASSLAARSVDGF